MLQPHEGIRGRNLTATDLLSLDFEAFKRRQIMCTQAHLLWKATMGGHTPQNARWFERLNNPQVGDLVVEWACYNMRGRDVDTKCKAFGYLVAERDEWWQTDEEWNKSVAEDPDYYDEGDRPIDHAFYVQYGPDPIDICRWTNCSFIMVPTDLHFAEIPNPGIYRDGNATVFTREGLISSLADSGIQLRGLP